MDLLKNNQAWIWDEECQTAFESLKKMVMEEQVLRLSDVTTPFELHTNALDFAIRGPMVSGFLWGRWMEVMGSSGSGGEGLGNRERRVVKRWREIRSEGLAMKVLVACEFEKLTRIAPEGIQQKVEKFQGPDEKINQEISPDLKLG
nr:hypothetical protein CTI12_AA187700 [Tanacetum cinerariifolium]